MRCVTTDAVVGRSAVEAGRCCGTLTPGTEAPADLNLLGETTDAAAAAVGSWVPPPASSAASIASLEQRLLLGRPASAEGERTSHAAVTGREATSVAYSHA